MKHLKRFNEDIEDPFSEEAVKEVFESYINWNMIHDAKDLALELLDKGFILNIEVDYDEEIPIYTLKFSHSLNKGKFEYFKLDNTYRFPDGVYSLEPVDVELITYNIYFTDGSFSGTEITDEINRLEANFKSELQDRYPKMEKNMFINQYGFGNF